MSCHVFVGLSLDGYIADSNGGLGWLSEVPNPDGSDYGYAAFAATVDAIVMGRRTFETVLGFGSWPYHVPVTVMSTTLETLPAEVEEWTHGDVELSDLPPPRLVEDLARRGADRLYIDGGGVVTSFLKEDLIDEMTLSRVPVVLGGGVPLFGNIGEVRWFEHVETTVFNNALVQSRYRRLR